MVNDPLTPRQSRLRAATLVITTAAGLTLLLQDWGPGNAFSGIRPALKSVLNRVYRTETQQPSPQCQQDHSPSPAATDGKL